MKIVITVPPMKWTSKPANSSICKQSLNLNLPGAYLLMVPILLPLLRLLRCCWWRRRLLTTRTLLLLLTCCRCRLPCGAARRHAAALCCPLLPRHQARQAAAAPAPAGPQHPAARPDERPAAQRGHAAAAAAPPAEAGPRVPAGQRRRRPAKPQRKPARGPRPRRRAVAQVARAAVLGRLAAQAAGGLHARADEGGRLWVAGLVGLRLGGGAGPAVGGRDCVATR
jgi:hypothetical protein